MSLLWKKINVKKYKESLITKLSNNRAGEVENLIKQNVKRTLRLCNETLELGGYKKR